MVVIFYLFMYFILLNIKVKKTSKLLFKFLQYFSCPVFHTNLNTAAIMIEYQFLLTDVYNLVAHEKHLCQNYVYLSPKIYVRSFVCVQKRCHDS